MVNDCCLLSVNLIDHLLRIWTPEVHIYNVNIPLFKDVSSTKIFFTRLLENQTGSLFRLLSTEENETLEISSSQTAAKAERNLREEVKAENEDEAEIPERDYGDVKQWTWSLDFTGLEKFVNEHGDKGGGMTDGWCINQRWASVTPLRAAFQVVDGGSGDAHGGQQIILDKSP
jgi:broad specificity polyphosphatase/5'/3'-nucleotidase SurE